MIAKGDGYELRLGAYQDVMQDVTCDLLCVDAPYSEHTHSKQTYDRGTGYSDSHVTARGIGYEHWTPENVDEFCVFWSSRTRGWIVSITDSELYPAWRDSLRAQGRYVFAPLPAFMPGMNVRLAGDGPSNWTCWIVVARPKTMKAWGTLSGGYTGSPGTGPDRGALAVVGAKPLWLIKAITQDYSRHGQVVCDPCAGGGTTLRAAMETGRIAIGSEIDPVSWSKSATRLSAPVSQTDLDRAVFADAERRKIRHTPIRPAVQPDLFGG